MEERKGLKLGFGLMRLPRLADGSIDLEQTAKMVDLFMEAGGTYFDTAYAYNGSEEAARKVLVERYPRDSFTLATKLIVTAGDTSEEKVKKEELRDVRRDLRTEGLILSLKETQDIARALGERKGKHQQLIGFALETEHEKENALRKMARKQLDAIVLNSLRNAGAGFGTDTNCVTIFCSDGRSFELPLQSKTTIADGIIEALI